MASYDQREEETTIKQFNGSLSEMRDSPWISSEDLENKQGPGHISKVVTILQIMEVKNAKFKGGRTKKKCHGIVFDAFEGRMLCVNADHRETLKNAFGKQSSDVIGKKVVLYVDPNVKLMGKIVNGLRIKPYAATKEEHEPAPQLTAEEAKYVTKMTADIEVASDADLDAVANVLKDKSPVVRAALGPVWKKRKRELAEQTKQEAKAP